MRANVSYLLRIYCATFNHHAYINDTLNGFAMQQTTFPFICTIVDDASTDGEQEVIKKYVQDNFDLQDASVAYERDTDYGHVTFAQHKTNKNCFFAVILLKENHYSQKKPKAPYLTEWKDTKYIALCEGDDYWTDPLKLQKQVDFLEANVDYSLCFHKVSIVSNNEKDLMLFSQLKEGDYTARQIYEKWTVPTCSVLYRNYLDNPFEKNSAVIFGDIFIWLQLAERGKLRCLGFVGASYRRYQGSASCNYPVETSIRLYYQYLFFEKRFPELKDVSRRKQDEEGLADIVKAAYFPGIWKYRMRYVFRHKKRLLFSKFCVDTFFLYTPIRHLIFWKKL